MRRERWWTREPEPGLAVPAGPACAPRPNGFDFVPRRLLGVLFLTPLLLAQGLGLSLRHLLTLTFRPHQARASPFSYGQAWRRAARFAWYDDFVTSHWWGLLLTALAYSYLWHTGSGG